MSRTSYCVCGDYSVGPRTVVSGSAHHSREKCITYAYDRDGKKSVVRFVSTSEGLVIPGQEARS